MSASHDRIAERLGAIAPRFAQQHEDIVVEMKSKLTDYLVQLERSLLPAGQTFADDTPHSPRPELQITTNAEGFPQLPIAPESPLKHDDSVLLVRAFLNAHYSKRDSTTTPLPYVMLSRISLRSHEGGGTIHSLEGRQPSFCGLSVSSIWTDPSRAWKLKTQRIE